MNKLNYVLFFITVGIGFSFVVYLANLITFRYSKESIFYNFKKGTNDYDDMLKKSSMRNILLSFAIVIVFLALILAQLNYFNTHIHQGYVSTLIFGSALMIFINLLIIGSIRQNYKK